MYDIIFSQGYMILCNSILSYGASIWGFEKTNMDNKYKTGKQDSFLVLMHEEWLNNVGFKPKLGNYVKYKQNTDAESYVTRSQRFFLVHFTTGILPLHIETGCCFRKPLAEDCAYTVIKIGLKLNTIFCVNAPYIRLKDVLYVTSFLNSSHCFQKSNSSN